jgi:SAM-dependent methyltransferase
MTAAPLLSGRSREPERMDVERTTDEDLARCLAHLERVNVLSLGYRPTLRWLDRIAAGRDRLSVLDVGCGHGDMLRRIARWARRRGVTVDLAGVDLNPRAIAAAAAATPPDVPVRWITADLFALDPADRFDVVVSALFAHHLDDAGLVRFVEWMQRSARVGWFVNDLHRHWLPERFLRAAFAVMPVHRFVRHDGPVSVRRALVRSEWRAVLDAAGVDPARVDIAWHAPFRWGVGTRPWPPS